jgi:hypothetical protein
MSLRPLSLKRRPTVSEAQVEPLIQSVRELMKQYPAGHMINIDETNWRTVAAGYRTWGVTSAESVHIIVDNDDKQGVIVIAAISAAGDKSPLTVVGKGKTQRCLTGYALPPEV